jgi:hypothetical protein
MEDLHDFMESMVKLLIYIAAVVMLAVFLVVITLWTWKTIGEF